MGSKRTLTRKILSNVIANPQGMGHRGINEGEANDRKNSDQDNPESGRERHRTARGFDCSPELARHVLDEMVRHMYDAMADGEDVKISEFGTFKLSDKNPRMGRNPLTLEPALISPGRVVTFKPSVLMKDRFKRGNRGNRKD